MCQVGDFLTDLTDDFTKRKSYPDVYLNYMLVMLILTMDSWLYIYIQEA